MNQQPAIFISYSHRDSAEKDLLMSHLGVLQGAGLIDLWSDDRIGAGQDWHLEIKQAIAGANIAVLLITANFLNSEFILSNEVPELLKRRQHEGLPVIPVIARACAWRAVDWLRQMMVRPKDGSPVWSNGGTHVDEKLTIIAEEIFDTIQKQQKLTPPNPPSISVETILSQDKEKAAPPQSCGPWRVLVVDDEESWQKRIKRILNEINCKVLSAGNYEQAEDLLAGSKFDLVTIDLNLDKSTQYADGFELVLRIRELFGPAMPIVIITGTGHLEEQRRAFRDYNVVDFIPKSQLNLEEFQEIVRSSLVNSAGYVPS